MSHEIQALEETVHNKLSEIASLKSQIATQDEHISSIVNHLANLFDQLNETQNLCNAKVLEFQSEINWQKSMKAEESRIRQENENLHKNLIKLREKKLNQLSVLTKLEAKAEQLRKEFQANHNHIFSWVEEAIIKEQSQNKLRHYILEDSSKLKKLSLQIEALTAEELKKQQLVDQTLINLKTIQLDFEKTSDSFKSAHQECQRCIQQWEMAVKQIQTRDEEIEAQISRVLEVKEELSHLQKENLNLEDQIKCFNRNNEDLLRQINKAEREITRLQIELQDSDSKRNEFQKELNSLKSSKCECERQLEQIQAEIEFQNKKLKNGNLRLNKLMADRKALSEELNNESGTTESAKHQHETLEMWLAQEIKYQESVKVEWEIRNRDLAQKRKQLLEIKDSEKLKKMELQKLKNINGGNVSILKKLEDDLEDQNKLLQNKDKEIERLQCKLNSMKGSVSCPSDFNSRLQLLNETIASKTIACQTLNQDTIQQQNYINWQEKDLKRCNHENGILKEKMDDINHEYDVSQKELQEQMNFKQKLVVKEVILKLEVRRLNEISGQKSATLNDVAKRREQMEEMVIKRQQSIKNRQEELEKEIRLEENNKKSLVAQLAEITSKTDHLKKRYEIELMPLASCKNSEVEPYHFLAKVEEDKNNLKLENSKYQDKLQKGTVDMITYQNTLQILNNKNESLWTSIYRSPDNDDLVQEVLKLEEEFNETSETLVSKRKETNKIEDVVEQLHNVLSQTDTEINHYTRLNDDKQRQLKDTSSSIEELQTKQNRAFQLINKIKKNLQGNLYEDDIILKIIQKYNKDVSKSISDVLQDHPEITPLVERQLETYQFHFTQKSRRVSASSSQSASSIKLPSGFSGQKQKSDFGSLPSTSDGRRTASSRSTLSMPSVVKIEFEDTSQQHLRGGVTKAPVVPSVGQKGMERSRSSRK